MFPCSMWVFGGIRVLLGGIRWSEENFKDVAAEKSQGQKIGAAKGHFRNADFVVD